MSYLLIVLSVGLVSAGVLILVGKGSLLRLPSIYGPCDGNFSRQQQWIVGGVLLFVGMLLSATTYSIVVRGNPYWFIDYVFQLFT